MRIFVADNREHPDPDPSLTIEQVRDMMADFLPDLVGATWTETPRPNVNSAPGDEMDTIIDFNRRVGTKGEKYLVRRTIDEWTIVDEAEDGEAAVQAAIAQDEWHHSDENYEAELSDEVDALFPTGQVVMTSNLQHKAEEAHGLVGTAERIAEVIRKHIHGDWRDISDEDKLQNDRAVESNQDRIFSAYDNVFDFKVWVITEWDRSVTTILLPADC